MINNIKEKIMNVINKIRYYRKNKWIEQNNINMLGTCYKYITEEYTLYIRIVSVINDDDINKFIGLVYKIPKNMDNKGTVLMTNDYGPYLFGNELPSYKDSYIIFEEFNLDAFDNYEEISMDEFTSNLTSLMDNILSIGY